MAFYAIALLGDVGLGVISLYNVLLSEGICQERATVVLAHFPVQRIHPGFLPRPFPVHLSLPSSLVCAKEPPLIRPRMKEKEQHDQTTSKESTPRLKKKNPTLERQSPFSPSHDGAHVPDSKRRAFHSPGLWLPSPWLRTLGPWMRGAPTTDGAFPTRTGLLGPSHAGAPHPWRWFCRDRAAGRKGREGGRNCRREAAWPHWLQEGGFPRPHKTAGFKRNQDRTAAAFPNLMVKLVPALRAGQSRRRRRGTSLGCS